MDPHKIPNVSLIFHHSLFHYSIPLFLIPHFLHCLMCISNVMSIIFFLKMMDEWDNEEGVMLTDVRVWVRVQEMSIIL